MTDAQVSQVAVEVVRTNLAVSAQVSQLAVEVLRPNVGKKISASAGSFALTGVASSSIYLRKLSGATGSVTLTGQAAGFLRGLEVAGAKGTFTLTGRAAEFLQPGKLRASAGAFTLSGVAANLRRKCRLVSSAGVFMLTGRASTGAISIGLVALPGVYTLTGGTMVSRGIIGGSRSFTFTGIPAAFAYRHARVITEALFIRDPATNSWSGTTQIADAFKARDALVPIRGELFSEGLGVGESLINKLYRTALINEIIALADVSTSSSRYHQTVLEPTRIADAINLAYPRAFTDSVVLADVASVVRGMIVLEQLRIIDSPTGNARYYTQLVDGLRASDSLRNFFAGDFADTITITESLLRNPILIRSISDTMGIVASLSSKLVIRIISSDAFNLDDTTLTKWIFRPVVTDDIEISLGLVEPSGSFTSWAVNTRTGAVTEYQNYEFNSFAQTGHKYLGASSSGLYELDGDTDDGDDVIAQIRSGYSQFGGSRYSSFKAAYLGMRGNGDIILKLDAGDGNTYTYQTVIQDMQSTKVRLGKGLRARYFAFELISTGPDFDLDTIEFIPLVAQRRV